MITIAENKPVHPKRQWRTFTLREKPELTITGYSRSGDTTFFHVPEIKLALDAGEAFGRQPETVLLTQSNINYSKDLPDMCWLRDLGCDVFCPKESVEKLNKFVYNEIELNKGGWKGDYVPRYTHKIIGVEQNEYCEFHKGYRARVIKCYHKQPCVGYAVEEKSIKLKPEFAGLPSAEIGKLRKNGVDITETTYKKLFVYLGNTHIKVLKENPWIFEYPIVIVNCTYLHQKEEYLESAEKDGFIIWSQLEEYVVNIPQVTFVLTHFSIIYDESEVYEFFKQQSTRINLKNVILLIGNVTIGSEE